MSALSTTTVDMNLLVTLDALLSEGSVAGAAQRMNLSSPAMSRQLTRIRHLLKDPILVRAGRGLVPTPRAQAIRDRLRNLVIEAETLVRGEGVLDLATLERTFTVRTGDGFVARVGAKLANILADEAPRMRLRFAPQGKEDVDPLRQGEVDIDVGVIDAMGPEIRLQALMHDTYVCVVRTGHPLAGKRMTANAFARFPHVSVSRRGRFEGPIDAALANLGLKRDVSLAVASFADALAVARTSNYIVSVPQRLTKALCSGLLSFPLPVPTDKVAISMAWHPRFDADPAHRWLRLKVREACRASSTS